MATSPVPQWAREMSPTYHGPTAGGVLQLAALVLVLVLAFQWFTATDSGRSQVDTKQGVSLCAEHRGAPGWSSVCQPGKASARR
jgi:hypothetical protein